jgi:hypothetical protein
MFQLIVGARQACDVIAVKQPCCKVGGLMAKMLKCFLKRFQRGEFAPHLRQVRLVPFLDMLPGVLLWVGQDCFCLIQEAVGVLQGVPQRRRGLQAFGEKLLQLL